MDAETRLNLITGAAQEVVGVEHLQARIADGGVIRAYVGFEPVEKRTSDGKSWRPIFEECWTQMSMSSSSWQIGMLGLTTNSGAIWRRFTRLRSTWKKYSVHY